MKEAEMTLAEKIQRLEKAFYLLLRELGTIYRDKRIDEWEAKWLHIVANEHPSGGAPKDCSDATKGDDS